MTEYANRAHPTDRPFACIRSFAARAERSAAQTPSKLYRYYDVVIQVGNKASVHGVTQPHVLLFGGEDGVTLGPEPCASWQPDFTRL